MDAQDAILNETEEQEEQDEILLNASFDAFNKLNEKKDEVKPKEEVKSKVKTTTVKPIRTNTKKTIKPKK